MRYLFVAILSLFFVTANAQEVDLNKLNRTYKTQLITGGITLAGAGGCVAGFVAKRSKYEDYTQATGEPKNNYLKEARICLVFAGVLSGISIYSFVKGAKNRQKYIELSGSSDGVSMRVTF